MSYILHFSSSPAHRANLAEGPVGRMDSPAKVFLRLINSISLTHLQNSCGCKDMPNSHFRLHWGTLPHSHFFGFQTSLQVLHFLGLVQSSTTLSYSYRPSFAYIKAKREQKVAMKTFIFFTDLIYNYNYVDRSLVLIKIDVRWVRVQSHRRFTSIYHGKFLL